MTEMQPYQRITAAIEKATAAGRVGLVPYITAGYPKKNEFIKTLKKVAAVGDVVEVGVPFSDPMADGVTIQRASHQAIADGVSLRWILKSLHDAGELDAPVVLMSYLNPLPLRRLNPMSAVSSCLICHLKNARNSKPRSNLGVWR